MQQQFSKLISKQQIIKLYAFTYIRRGGIKINNIYDNDVNTRFAGRKWLLLFDLAQRPTAESPKTAAVLGQAERIG